MPDPFSFTDPLAQPYLGGMPAPQQSPMPQPPAAPKSVVGSMIAPATPKPPAALSAPVQFPGLPAAPAASQAAQQPQGNVDQFMQLVRTHESGGNDKASSGVADGRYQFTPDTWAGVAREHPELGLRPNDIWDGAKQDLAMRAISKDYVNVLTMNGIQPSMPNMFMLHFLGTGGGPKFLKQMEANPNANAAALFPKEAQYNPTIFHDNAGQPRSLQQVYALMTKTFGGPSAKMAPISPEETKAIRSFDKAAGVTTDMRGFTAQAPQMETSLEEIPGGLKPLPGMTPIKETLKPLPGMTPINGGLKLDYNSKDPLKPTNPYAEDAKPKDDKISPETIGVDPTTGMPIFADEKLNREALAGEAEMTKGVAAGVAQDFTGPASLLPNALGGGYAEQANEALGKTGDPFGRVVGNIAPMAIPAGEILGGIKAGGKALEAGESLLPAFGKTVAQGGVTGALSSTSDPTGHDDAWGERLGAKAKNAVWPGLIGGALAGAAPAVGAAAQWLGGDGTMLGNILRGTAGKEAEKLVEELRTGVNSKTGKALTAEEQKKAEAKLTEMAETAKKEAAEADLKKVTDAQAKLAERERVRAAENRDARQTPDPKAAEKLREGVTARARERVRVAEEQAKAAGATESQAKTYAVEQEQKVLEAKTAAEEIATAYTKDPPSMTKEKFGEMVQKAAADMEEKAEKAREEAAGFKEAMKSAPPGPVVRNDNVMKILDDIDASSADRSVHAITNEVRNQFKTWRRTAEGEWEVADAGGITVERADSLRKVLNTALRSRKMAVEGGSADASAAQHHIGKVLDALEDATGAAHPPYNAAVKAWRDNSRGALDEFLPKQALGNITKTQEFSGRFAMNEGRVVTEILSQSNAGAGALVVLAKQNPEIKAATEQYLDRQLLGFEGAKVPTAKSVTAFIDKNQSTLEKLDLIEKYTKMRDTLAGAGKNVESAKAAAEIAKGEASQAENQRRALEKVADERRSILERSKKEQPGDVFSPVGGEPKDVAKSAAEKAKIDAERLKEKATEPKSRSEQAAKEMTKAAATQKAAEAARKDFKQFESSLKTVAPREVPSLAQSAIEKLHKEGYIDDAELEQYNQQIADIKAKYKESDWADRVRHFVIYPAAASAFSGMTGIGIHEYVRTKASAP